MMSKINIDIMTDKEKTALVCLYFAQLKSSDDKYKKNCHSSLHLLADKFGYKYSNIKNDKDAYDALFDNGRSGWHDRPLEKRSKYLFDFYETYKSYPLEAFEDAANRIISEAKKDDALYFSIKTKNAETVEDILSKKKNIEFDGLNILQDSIKKGQLVFVVLGGDKPKWNTGLIGVGIVSEEPYDIGYSGRNYKIKVDMKLLLNKPVKREDLVPYKDTYGIIGIAPITTKWEPNQAISQMTERNAVSLMRAMLEICPEIESELEEIVDSKIMSRIKGSATMFIPVEVNYKENPEEIIKEKLEDFSSGELHEEMADKYTREDFLNEVFLSETDYDTLCELLEMNKNVILQGAPGVGKTFAAKRLAYSILGRKYDSCIKMVQFHQSYSYEDFIMGFRPTENGFVLSPGPFYGFCEKARSDKRKHFFIIDEINRGNLSKIFGELLMLIEADKRGEKVNILYKNKEFGIPENVYIIGMMNTADRSLAIIDYALRRRFSFFEMEPAFDSEKFIDKLAGSSEKTDKVIAVIKQLNQDISEDDSLGKGFRIGHSYFCRDKVLDENMLRMIIKYEILPLINEYWFDEPSKYEQWSERLLGALK